jgi:hypothetical protein
MHHRLQTASMGREQGFDSMSELIVWTYMERVLKEREWLAADRFTVADLLMAMFSAWLEYRPRNPM